MVDGERYTGPQRVSRRAQEIQGCPFEGASTEEFWEGMQPVESGTGATKEDYAQERVNFYAMSKVLTDELAVRLPGMRDKYPPYGLPELYRDHSMETPEWVTVREIRHDDARHLITGRQESPFKGMLAVMNRTYSSKMTVHFYDEIGEMYGEPDYRDAISAISVHRVPNSGYYRNHGTTDEEAVARLMPPIENAQDTMLGMFHALPAVFEETYGRQPTHDEAVSILRNSKRLPIMLSLLPFSKFQALLVSSLTKAGPADPYGWDFKPEIFTVEEVEEGKNKGDLYMDWNGGISSLPIYNFAMDHGEFGDNIVPQVARDESESLTMDDVKTRRDTLTCPARKFISAMWDDMVDIADQARLYDLLQEQPETF